MKKTRIPNTLLTFAVITVTLLNTTPTAHAFLKVQRLHDDHKILMKIVHEPHWDIIYVFGEECPAERKAEAKEFEEEIVKAIQLWLQPLRELNTGKPIVNEFRFQQHDERPSLEIQEKVDLIITDYCIHGRSNAGLAIKWPPDLGLRKGLNVDARFSALVHELGHAFGLGDAYVGRSEREPSVSKGGLINTIGTQPASVMAMHLILITGRFLTEDDENGIVWLYKVVHEGWDDEDCLYPNYRFEKAPDGCVPKWPLIFEIRQGHEIFANRILDEDPNIDVNAQNAIGFSALHYAVKDNHSDFLNRLLTHRDINVNLRDDTGSTVLFWATKLGLYGVTDRILKHPDVDIEIADNSGTTPLQLAMDDKEYRIVNQMLEVIHDTAWTEVKTDVPTHHQSVFYLVPAIRKNRIFHVGYVGTVPGNRNLFVAHKAKSDSILDYADKEMILVGHKGVVVEDILIRELGSFPRTDGETGSLLLSIKGIDMSDYKPLQLAEFPVQTETTLELLSYKMDAAELTVSERKDALRLPLQVRSCDSLPHADLEAQQLRQHLCGTFNNVSDGSLFFDKSDGSLIGFYRKDYPREDIDEGLPLADVVSEALMRGVGRLPVESEDKLATTWGGLKQR